MKHSMVRKLRKTAAVLSAMTLLCASASELPVISNLMSGQTITASAYWYEQSFNTQIPMGSRKMIWPLPESNNYITGSFEDDRRHGALDISAATGTVVYAVADGTVYDCGWGGGYGNFVTLSHTFGGTTYYTQYSHLSQVNVQKNQEVSQSDIIGKVGMTGKAEGPHLDFQIKRQAKLMPSPSWEIMCCNIDPGKVLKLPSKLHIYGTNTDTIGKYLDDITKNDRCPDAFRKWQPGSLARTLECERSPHKVGKRSGNTWLATVSDPAGWMVYGPYEKYSTGRKAAVFRLKTDFNTDKVYTNLNGQVMDEIVCTVEVSDHTANQKQLAKMDIYRSDFLKSETWQDFNLYFTNNYSNHLLEFRIYYHKKAAIWGDKVMLRTL